MARNCRSALPRQLWSGSAPEGPSLSTAAQSLLRHVTATEKISRAPRLDHKLLETSVSGDTDSSRACVETLGPEAHCWRAAGEEPPPPAARDHVGNTDQVGTRDMQSDRWEASCHSLGTPRASSQGWGPPPSLSPTRPQTHRGSRADLTTRCQHLPQPRQAGGRRGGSAAPPQAPPLSKRARRPQAPPPGLAAPAGAAAAPQPPAGAHGPGRPHTRPRTTWSTADCAHTQPVPAAGNGGALQRGHPTLPSLKATLWHRALQSAGAAHKGMSQASEGRTDAEWASRTEAAQVTRCKPPPPPAAGPSQATGPKPPCPRPSDEDRQHSDQ